MKKLILSSLFISILGGFVYSQTFTLKSRDLSGQFTNINLGNSFGCHGLNKSPQLYWENAPKDTKSFAVTMYDKDAPTGSGFWHWIIYNIPSTISELSEDAGNLSQNKLPLNSICGRNDGGTFEYTGPCPPLGQNHMYLITVYALKTNLILDKNASAALIGFMLNTNSIEKASIAIYGKQK